MLVNKVWRNLRVVIEQRRREGNMVDNQINLLHMLRSLRNVISDNVNSLWTGLCRSAKFWLSCLISCILVSCLLTHIGCEFTSVVLPIHLIFMHLMFHHFNSANQATGANITNNEPTTPVTNSSECTDKFKYDTGSMGTTVCQSDSKVGGTKVGRDLSDGNSFHVMEEFQLLTQCSESASDAVIVVTYDMS